MSDWLIQTYEDGTLAAGERNFPDPKTPQYSFESLQDLIDFCDKKIAEINAEWNQSPDKDGKEPTKYSVDETWPENAKREFENWNFEVDRYNEDVKKWQDLKDAALVQ